MRGESLILAEENLPTRRAGCEEALAGKSRCVCCIMAAFGWALGEASPVFGINP
jgi:hypothetical protein